MSGGFRWASLFIGVLASGCFSPVLDRGSSGAQTSSTTRTSTTGASAGSAVGSLGTASGGTGCGAPAVEASGGTVSGGRSPIGALSTSTGTLWPVSCQGIPAAWGGTGRGVMPLCDVVQCQVAQSIAAADLNADGKPDVVVSNGSACVDSVSVLLGNGDGTFTTASPLNTDPGPAGLAVGDLDGDGKPDLIVADYNANTVDLFYGNGDGTFATGVSYCTLTEPLNVGLVPSQKGPPEIAVSCWGGESINIYSSSAARIWSDTETLNSVVWPGGLAVEGTGHTQIFSGSSAGSGLSILDPSDVNTVADIGFSASPESITGFALGDFNGDGVVDLALLDTLGGQIAVGLGSQGFTVGSSGLYADAERPVGIVAADFNGDGHLDLAVVDSSQPQIQVFHGNGDGTFASPRASPLKAPSRAIASADFNGDGIPDVVVARQSAGSVEVVLGPL